MNKLHNFSFVGEFPMFQSPEDNGSLLNGSRNNLQMLSQEIYLPLFDNSKAYDDHTENDTDVTCYNLRFLEGNENPVNLVDNVSLDDISSPDFIFFENLDRDLQNVLPDISLQDIFLDPFVMNVGENIQTNSSSDFVFSDNDVMNLYYWNENPVKERKMKALKGEKENKHKKRRTV